MLKMVVTTVPFLKGPLRVKSCFCGVLIF
uniref:Uncharacterized protein n=1 Tax=Anguilla anguilla TaxID=7936 RepID=A0A0E9PKW1_ANGAN